MMIALLKSLMFSNIWENPQHIRNLFMKKSEEMEFREFLLSIDAESFVF
jgi:hypothetical protein